MLTKWSKKLSVTMGANPHLFQIVPKSLTWLAFEQPRIATRTRAIPVPAPIAPPIAVQRRLSGESNSRMFRGKSELAKRKPLRAVFRDTGFGSDATKINVEQIFKALSPGTEVKSI